jgi:hypothetical protein
MPYKYLDLGTPPYMSTTKQELTDGFQALLNDQFEHSPTYQTIQEEYSFASGSFIDVNVRVNTAVNSITGEKLGDDFKRILFKDLDHATGIGYKYYFDNNFWIAVFSETIKNIAASCMVRRCNTRLRWMTTSGSYYEEPCAIDYKIARPRDSIGTENPVLPQGFIDVYAQLNSKTRLIKSNQRFLFGPAENRIALKVFGTGIQNALNQEALDDQSSRLATFSMGGNYVNPDTDDLVNGIADRYLDFGTQTSASMAGIYSIISNPVTNYILESGSRVYDVRYYLGSTVQSGSFVFSVSGSSVPVANYTFSQLTNNTFSIVNNQQWLTDPLNILCSGSSGSRILSVELKGAW